MPCQGSLGARSAFLASPATRSSTARRRNSLPAHARVFSVARALVFLVIFARDTCAHQNLLLRALGRK